jgi:hypothetical protein
VKQERENTGNNNPERRSLVRFSGLSFIGYESFFMRTSLISPSFCSKSQMFQLKNAIGLSHYTITNQ